MDAQIVIIGVAVFVVSALLIYLISVFGTREKTYEEVIEEQRKKNIELFGKPSSESDKKKEKKKKPKKPKSEKLTASQSEEIGQSQEDETDAEPPVRMVELELEPEIIEPELSVKGSEVRKRIGKKAKPILHNKDEKSPVGTDFQVEETFHTKATPPMDAVELKHERERRLSGTPPVEEQTSPKQNKKSKKAAAAKEATKQEPVVVEEVIQAEAVSPVQAELPRKGKKGKGSGSPPPEDQKDSEVARLQISVGSAQLTDGEIQVLVEQLLAKQSSSAVAIDWTKKSQKGDPMTLLKKQLQEKEKALEEEHSRAESANNAVKELRQQISSEKQQQQTSTDKLKQNALEIEALQKRMQTSMQQHMDEVRALQSQLGTVQRLTEENKSLKEAALNSQQSFHVQSQGDCNMQQQLKIMSEEMSKNCSQLASKDSSINILEVKLQRYEEKIRSMEGIEANRQSNESVLTQKLNEVSHQLQQAQAQNQSIATESQRAQQELNRLRSQLSSQQDQSHGQYKAMEGRMQDMEQQVLDRDAALQTIQSQLVATQMSIQEKDQQLKDVEQSKSRLESELKVVSEQHQKESASQPDHQKISEIKDEDINRLQQELSAKQAEITRISDDLEAQRRKNEDSTKSIDELETRLQSNQQSVDTVLASQAQQQSELQEQVAQLKAQLVEQSQQSEAGQSALSESDLAQLQEEVTKLRAEVESKDNELQSAQSKATSLDEQLKNTKNQLDTNASDVETLESRNSTSEQELTQLREKLASEEEKMIFAQSQLAENTEKLQSVQQQLATALQQQNAQKQSVDLEKQLATLQQQLDISRKENDELRAGCEKATAALTAAESAAEEIAQVQKELSSKVSEVTSLQDAINKRDKQITDLRQQNAKTMDALAKVEKVAQENVSEVKSSENESELREAKSSNSKLLSQVQHYKAVLADTEGILNKLQTSVETEEKKWHAKMRVYEQELQITKTELNKIKADTAGAAEKIQNGTGSAVEEADEAVSAGTEAGTTL